MEARNFHKAIFLRPTGDMCHVKGLGEKIIQLNPPEVAKDST